MTCRTASANRIRGGARGVQFLTAAMKADCGGLADVDVVSYEATREIRMNSDCDGHFFVGEHHRTMNRKKLDSMRHPSAEWKHVPQIQLVRYAGAHGPSITDIRQLGKIRSYPPRRFVSDTHVIRKLRRIRLPTPPRHIPIIIYTY